MNATVNNILEKIRELEVEIEEELHRRAEELRYKVHDGRVVFEAEVLARHRALKIGIISYIHKARWMVILTAPVIYSLIIPFVVMDIFVTVYQFICFPIYRIPRVPRREYLVFDRVKLNYLNGIEKLNCIYCSYGNGIIAYAQEVGARTEQFWCPIKHADKSQRQHSRYHLFTDFGDAENYRHRLREIQRNYDDQTG